jgi:CrcB protein
MERLLWVCLAGAFGCGTRYLVATWAAQRLGSSFPFGTLFVNLAGCLLMGFITEVALHSANLPATLRIALTSGFLGGLTTYSSFNYETTRLLADQAQRNAWLNVGVTLLGCFVAGLLGLVLARRFIAP